jgi:hypothetical protein
VGAVNGYDDGTIVCGADRLEIRSYYFPFGTKSVPYTQIQGLQRIEIRGLWSGKWRLWGTGNPRYWANLDRKRPKKTVGFVVDLGRQVSPIVTPDEPDAFESVLRGRANPRGGQRPSDEGSLHLTGRSRQLRHPYGPALDPP